MYILLQCYFSSTTYDQSLHEKVVQTGSLIFLHGKIKDLTFHIQCDVADKPNYGIIFNVVSKKNPPVLNMEYIRV